MTDGTHVVSKVTEINFTAGAAVSAGSSGTADVAISGSGGSAMATTTIIPSGDTTGATDTAAINTALSAGDARVVLVGTPGGTPFWLDAPIVMQTNTTLVLWDAHVKLIADARCNLICNQNATLTGTGQTQNYGGTADSMIRVVGIGEAWLDGNASNQGSRTLTGNTTSMAGIQWVNASDVIVRDVRVGPICWMACVSIATTKLRWVNVDVAQDRSTTNQDGIDVGPGCSDVRIYNTTGQTSDDCHSIWAKYGAVGGANITPWATAAKAASLTNLSSSDIRIFNSVVAVGDNFIRVQAGDGASLSDVHAYNLSNVDAASYTPENLLQLGNLSYVTTPPSPEQFHDITIDGFVGTCTNLVALDSYASDIEVKNVRLESPFTYLLGSGTATMGHGVRLSKIRTTDTKGPSDYVMYMPIGSSWDDVDITDVSMEFAKYVLNNQGTVTNLRLDRISVRTATEFCNSEIPETGWVNNVTFGNPTITGLSGTSLRFGPNMPPARGTNSIANTGSPNPTFGSLLVAASDVALTGSASGSNRLVIADGTQWNQICTLPDMAAPNHVGYLGRVARETAESVSTLTLTVGAGGVPVGNLLTLGAVVTGTTLSSVADSRSNTYTVDVSETNGTITAHAAHSVLTTALQAGDTITLTLAASCTAVVAEAGQFQLHSASGALDQTAVSTGTSTTLSVGPTSATTSATEFAVAVFAIPGAPRKVIPASGWTTMDAVTSMNGSDGMIILYEGLTATGAVTASCTVVGSQAYAGVVATYVA